MNIRIRRSYPSGNCTGNDRNRCSIHYYIPSLHRGIHLNNNRSCDRLYRQHPIEGLSSCRGYEPSFLHFGAPRGIRTLTPFGAVFETAGYATSPIGAGANSREVHFKPADTPQKALAGNQLHTGLLLR
jgi:hypothetical protein